MKSFYLTKMIKESLSSTYFKNSLNKLNDMINQVNKNLGTTSLNKHFFTVQTKIEGINSYEEN